MFQTIKNAFKLQDLRSKIFFTLLIVLIYRIGAAIPVPFINAEALSALFAAGAEQSNTIFGYLNILSGNAFSQATVFALSVSPYITAQIVIQLLTIAIPALERLSKEGEEGQKKINMYTRILTILLSIVMSYGYYSYLNYGIVGVNGEKFIHADGQGFFGALVIISCYCAGASIVMWIAEKINTNGIGNGVSIILLVNIVASWPASLYNNIVSLANSGASAGRNIQIVKYAASVVGVCVIAVLIVAFVIFITNSERRLQVQYAKRVVGRKMYGGQSTHLPMKLNMSGVMPIIFASSIVSLPATIASFFPNSSFWSGVNNFFTFDSPVYIILYFVLIILFSYFWATIQFNPIEVANNLKKNGGFITGIRPGKPTSDFIQKVLGKITLVGALFLGVIAVFPLIINVLVPIGNIAFGGSSLLIVVGVILETVQDLEAQITMRHYKGFLG